MVEFSGKKTEKGFRKLLVWQKAHQLALMVPLVPLKALFHWSLYANQKCHPHL